MSYSWDDYAVAWETADPGYGWKAIVTESTGSYDTAKREYSRMKANEIVYPEVYRNIRLMKRTTTVFEWKDVSP